MPGSSPSPNVLQVLVLGAGVMGKRHISSLREISAKVLEPRYGTRLEITAVDRRESSRNELPAGVRTFSSLEDALAAGKPDIAVMVFNDDQHISAFRTLFRECPGLKAVLTEKPLTERLEESREIEPELRKRYLSMNTVINFSPVFDRVKECLAALEQENGKLTPFGFEAIWGKNRTADPRPSIGVPSESVHALSVVSDMFGMNELHIESARALRGYLSTKATDVIYEMDATLRCGEDGLPLKFHTSYVFPAQNRKVTAYYEAPDSAIFAVEMDFDLKIDGNNRDRLRIHKISPATGALVTLVDEMPENIFSGVEPGLLKNDRITAFNSLSLIDFLTPAAQRSPEISRRLSELDTALEVQRSVEQINAENAAVAVTTADADPQALHAPKYGSPAAAAPQELLARIRSLKERDGYQDRNFAPRPHDTTPRGTNFGPDFKAAVQAPQPAPALKAPAGPALKPPGIKTGYYSPGQ